MLTRIKIYLLFPFSTLLLGCGNTMYFYETEKVSLTVEARPDSSQPVQGSLGIKQRVAMVVPKQNNNNKGGGEALSAISSFNFKILPESGTIFDPVLIQTAFITGEAAASLDQNKASKAAQAIQLGGINIPLMSKHAKCIISKVKSDPDKLNTLEQISAQNNFTELTESEWEKLGPDLEECGVLTRKSFKDSHRTALQKELSKL